MIGEKIIKSLEQRAGQGKIYALANRLVEAGDDYTVIIERVRHNGLAGVETEVFRDQGALEAIEPANFAFFYLGRLRSVKEYGPRVNWYGFRDSFLSFGFEGCRYIKHEADLILTRHAKSDPSEMPFAFRCSVNEGSLLIDLEAPHLETPGLYFVVGNQDVARLLRDHMGFSGEVVPDIGRLFAELKSQEKAMLPIASNYFFPGSH